MSLVIVDRMIGTDRFNVPFEETAYFQFGKKTIEIPVLLQEYLIDTIRRDELDKNLTVARELEWVQHAIYCSFFKITRKLVKENYFTFDETMHSTEIYKLLYSNLEDAMMNIDFDELYDYLQVNTLKWIQICNYIQEKILAYVYPKIVSAL